VPERELTMIFISHDISVVKYISDRIAVMYLGRLVEVGPGAEIVNRPMHPYTRALISAVPVPDPIVERARRRIILEGDPPSPTNPRRVVRFILDVRTLSRHAKRNALNLRRRNPTGSLLVFGWERFSKFPELLTAAPKSFRVKFHRLRRLGEKGAGALIVHFLFRMNVIV